MSPYGTLSWCGRYSGHDCRGQAVQSHLGTYVENPNIKVDWTQYAEYAAERMQQRGMTRELVNNIVENGEIVERITQIINDWDPIGFFPMAPKDEYINEIKKISEFVCSNHNLQVQPLAQAINKIFIETFGTDVYNEDLEQCTVIAKRILNVERK